MFFKVNTLLLGLNRPQNHRHIIFKSRIGNGKNLGEIGRTRWISMTKDHGRKSGFQFIGRNLSLDEIGFLLWIRRRPLTRKEVLPFVPLFFPFFFFFFSCFKIHVLLLGWVLNWVWVNLGWVITSGIP